MTIKEFKNYLSNIQKVLLYCKDESITVKCVVALVISAGYQEILKANRIEKVDYAFRSIPATLKGQGLSISQTLRDILKYRNNLAHVIDFNKAIKYLMSHEFSEYLEEFEVLLNFIDSMSITNKPVKLESPTVDPNELIGDKNRRNKGIMLEAEDIIKLKELLGHLPSFYLEDSRYSDLFNKINFKYDKNRMNLF